jgi:hypothetical protein
MVLSYNQFSRAPKFVVQRSSEHKSHRDMAGILDEYGDPDGPEDTWVPHINPDGALTIKACRMFVKHNIICFTMVPHCTHIIQPIDVSFAKWFKAEFSELYRQLIEADQVERYVGDRPWRSAAARQRKVVAYCANIAFQKTRQEFTCTRAWNIAGLSEQALRAEEDEGLMEVAEPLLEAEEVDEIAPAIRSAVDDQDDPSSVPGLKGAWIEQPEALPKRLSAGPEGPNPGPGPARGRGRGRRG